MCLSAKESQLPAKSKSCKFRAHSEPPSDAVVSRLAYHSRVTYRPLDKGGGGGRSPKKNFSALRPSVWSKNKGEPWWGAPPPIFVKKIWGPPGPPPPPPSDLPVASHDLAWDWVGILPFYSQFRLLPIRRT